MTQRFTDAEKETVVKMESSPSIIEAVSPTKRGTNAQKASKSQLVDGGKQFQQTKRILIIFIAIVIISVCCAVPFIIKNLNQKNTSTESTELNPLNEMPITSDDTQEIRTGDGAPGINALLSSIANAPAGQRRYAHSGINALLAARKHRRDGDSGLIPLLAEMFIKDTQREKGRPVGIDYLLASYPGIQTQRSGNTNVSAASPES